MAVEIVGLAGGGAAGHGLAEEVGQAAVDGVVLVDAGVVEGGDARGGAGPAAGAGLELVLEAAVGVLAAADVLDSAVDGGLGDLDAGVAGGAEGHDLADGDRDGGIVGEGIVAPAALLVLGLLDEADGLDEALVESVGQGGVAAAGGHAVDLAEEEGGEAVPVHGAVGGVAGDEAALVAVGEDVLGALGDVLAVAAPAREVAVGHEGDAGEGGDGDVLAEATVAEAAVGDLLGGEGLEALLDGGRQLGGDLVDGGVVLGGGGGLRGGARRRDAGAEALGRSAEGNEKEGREGGQADAVRSHRLPSSASFI